MVGPAGRVGTFAEAAAFGELLVLAVKGHVAAHLLRTLDAATLAGKAVLDTTNPIDEISPRNGVLRFFTNFDQSLMEACKKEVLGEHFVKAFNSVGAGVMVNPDFGGVLPSIFMYGNDEGVKTEAAEIVRAFDFEPENMGGAEAARANEPLSILWCIPSFRANEWTNRAFKLLKKN